MLLKLYYLRSLGGFASTGNVIGLGLTVRLFFSSGEIPECSKSKQCIKINI